MGVAKAGGRSLTAASGPKLDDPDLLPLVQLVGFDGHRHVVSVEPHRHVELEVGGNLVIVCPVFSSFLEG
jgi:hypothetical protein